MATILDEILKDPSRVGAVLLLALAVVSFLREWIVPGSTYIKALKDKDDQIAAIMRDRDEYKSLAFKTIEITERTQQIRGRAYEQGVRP